MPATPTFLGFHVFPVTVREVVLDSALFDSLSFIVVIVVVEPQLLVFIQRPGISSVSAGEKLVCDLLKGRGGTCLSVYRPADSLALPVFFLLVSPFQTLESLHILNGFKCFVKVIHNVSY